jgi:hypothetical protein
MPDPTLLAVIGGLMLQALLCYGFGWIMGVRATTRYFLLRYGIPSA